MVEAGLAGHQVHPGRVISMTGCKGVRLGEAAGLGVGSVSQLSLALELAQRLLSVSPRRELTFAHPMVVLGRVDGRPTRAELAFLAALGEKVSGASGVVASTPVSSGRPCLCRITPRLA